MSSNLTLFATKNGSEEMTFNCVKEIHAKPNDDGTYYVEIIMSCEDAEKNRLSDCTSQIPRAMLNIQVLKPDDGKMIDFVV